MTGNTFQHGVGFTVTERRHSAFKPRWADTWDMHLAQMRAYDHDRH